MRRRGYVAFTPNVIKKNEPARSFSDDHGAVPYDELQGTERLKRVPYVILLGTR